MLNSRSELRYTLFLALPIVLNQLGQFLMQVVDTLMVGKLGAVAIAAVAFGGSLTNAVMIIGLGFGTAIHVLISNAKGTNDTQEAHAVLRQGLILSFFGAILPGLVLSWGNAELVNHLGQPEEVVELGRGYFLYLLWSLLPGFAGLCFKNYFEAQMKPWLPLVLLVISIAINGFLNWVFIFGHFGIEPMGVTGAGLATFIARALNVVFLYYYACKGGFRFRLSDVWDISWSHVRKIVTLAIPSFFHILFEWGTFLISVLMMGWISAESMAAHQIALNYVGFVYMFPLGLACATTIRVGETLGRGDRTSVAKIAWGTTIVSASFTALCGLTAILFRHEIAGWFIADAAVILLAGKFIILDGIFQAFDGAQTVMLGALRGLQDVQVPTAMALAGYGIVGILFGYIAAFPLGFGACGIWFFLGLSLLVVAILFAWRLHKVLRKAGCYGENPCI